MKLIVLTVAVAIGVIISLSKYMLSLIKPTIKEGDCFVTKDGPLTIKEITDYMVNYTIGKEYFGLNKKMFLERYKNEIKKLNINE
jgi:hypothetical protein